MQWLNKIKWLKNLKIGYKFVISIFVIFTCITSLIAISFNNMRKSEENVNTIYDNKLIPISDLSVIEKNLYAIELYAMDMLSNKENSDFEEKMNIIENLREEDNQLLEKYEANELTTSEQTLLNDFYSILDDYREVSVKSLNYIENENYDAAMAINSQLDEETKKVTAAIHALVEVNKIQAELLKEQVFTFNLKTARNLNFNQNQETLDPKVERLLDNMYVNKNNASNSSKSIKLSDNDFGKY